jgi:pimeloyl-ACP methyl ester carboxylesterase
VLVHGGFSDHKTNWEFVKPLFEKQFTVYAMARRGRGETDATEGHSLDDESMDVVALMHSIGEPLFLLGHSYGAQVALAAAATVPDRVRKLVLYEPPWPHAISKEALARLEALARASYWADVALTFFRDVLCVPVHELDDLQATELWQPIPATTFAPSAFVTCTYQCCSRSVPQAPATSTSPTRSPLPSLMSASKHSLARRTKA